MNDCRFNTTDDIFNHMYALYTQSQIEPADAMSWFTRAYECGSLDGLAQLLDKETGKSIFSPVSNCEKLCNN